MQIHYCRLKAHHPPNQPSISTRPLTPSPDPPFQNKKTHTQTLTVPQAAEVAQGRTLRFLANVDPVDVARATQGLDPEETLVRTYVHASVGGAVRVRG